MRKTGLSHGAATLAALALFATPVSAQSVALDQYRAAPTAEDGFVLSRPVGLGHLRPGASLHLDYALSPLVLELDGRVTGQLVEHQLAGQIGVAFGLFDRFVAYARVPVLFVLEGQAVSGFPSADGAGLGDLALGARAVLHGTADDVFALALELEATLPTAGAARGQQQLLGDSGVTFTPRLLAEVRPHPIVRLQANLGARFREDVDFTVLRVGHELTWGVGAGVFVVEDVLEARVESWGSVGFATLDQPSGAPAELLGGLRVTPVSGLVIGLAGGFGLGTGYGTPAFRGALTIGWVGPSLASTSSGEEPARQEGTPQPVVARTDVEEPTPTATTETTPDPRPSGEVPDQTVVVADSSAPTPVDPTAPVSASERAPASTARRAPIAPSAYAELDRDGDRIPDAQDRCPIDREDFDEIHDEDGCPEEDADRDGLADTQDRCPLTEGSQRDPSCAGCPERACMATTGGSIDIRERVEFEAGSDVIQPASENVLRDVVSILGTNEQIRRIRIEGHTDSAGSDVDNLQLSRRRAASVRRWMVQRGIDASRIEAWGCGEAHPIQSNNRSAGRRANRRVEFLIVDPPTSQTLREGCQPAE